MRKIPSFSGVYKALYNRLTLKPHVGSIRIGLIGVGGWGAANAANIMRSRKFDIYGVFDKELKTAQKFANRYCTRYLKNLNDLFACSEIQAVAITVPNQFHAEMVQAAADSGKHVFIEKPLASSAEKCRELGTYCRNKNVILQVGHQVRLDPAFVLLKKLIDEGKMGKPLFIQAVHALERRNRHDWRQNALACPGGSMEQLGVHYIDVLLNVFGMPKSSKGWAKNIPCTISSDPDWGQIYLQFEPEIRASLSTTFSSPSHKRLEVFFDQGYFCTDGTSVLLKDSELRIQKITPKGLPGGVVQFLQFADSIKNGTSPEAGAEQAAVVMDVVQSIFPHKDKGCD